MNAVTRCLIVPAVVAALSPTVTHAQDARLPDGTPRGSQPAEIVQRMGGTEISLRYNRPSARGRVLFGGLLPYGTVWHPGADEASRIRFSRDVLVEGERLPAGAYSLWTIPGRESWTVIFSRAHDVFHTPYPEGRDALRLTIRPEPAPHVETMTFHFPMARRDSARLELRWGEVAVPLRIQAVSQDRTGGR